LVAGLNESIRVTLSAITHLFSRASGRFADLAAIGLTGNVTKPSGPMRALT
jgi:hypothetical protein